MANLSLFLTDKRPIEVTHSQNNYILVEDTLLSPEPPSKDPKNIDGRKEISYRMAK